MLLGKVLSLNETQTSVLTMVFKYCDDHQLLLLDLADLRAVLQFLCSDDGKTELAQYGGMSDGLGGGVAPTDDRARVAGCGEVFR